MKLAVLVATLVASVAFHAPADAASKKAKRSVHRAPASAVQSRAASSAQDVYVGNELIGRDPDPSIRAYMMRDPHPWDGPD